MIPTIGVLSTSTPMVKTSNLRLAMIQRFALAGHLFGYVSHHAIMEIVLDVIIAILLMIKYIFSWLFVLYTVVSCFTNADLFRK